MPRTTLLLLMFVTVMLATTVAVCFSGVVPREALPAMRTAELIDLNAADEPTLCLLPGIGPAMAGRIIADRDSNGPFESIDDVQRVKGIGPKTAAKLERWVRCAAP